MYRTPEGISKNLGDTELQTFSFSEAPKKIGTSKDFWLHPHNFCDIVNVSGGYSPIYMIFYSTKFSD